MKHPNNGPSFSKKPSAGKRGPKRFSTRKHKQRASTRAKKSSRKVRRKRLRNHPSLRLMTKAARRKALQARRSL